MGRRIEFNYDQAIDRATKLFWKTGYSNTSLRDLLKVMKIGEGSFYNSLKSKQSLYLECLKHYSQSVGRKRAEALFLDPSIKRGIRAFFHAVLDQLDNPHNPRSCLMANSVSCDVLKEKPLRQFFDAALPVFNQRLTERLSSAQIAGELSPQFKPELVTKIIGTYLQGLLRGVLISYDRKSLEEQIELFLTGLGF